MDMEQLDLAVQTWGRQLLAESGQRVDPETKIAIRLAHDGHTAFLSLYTPDQRRQAHMFIEQSQLASFLAGIAAAGAAQAVDEVGKRFG